MTSETQPRVIKVDKSNLLDLKNACDEALREYLENKAGFRQSHRHTDTKLILGYLGCAFAAAGSYYGYIHPFELSTTKFWTAVSVFFYYLFNVLMMAYAYLVEKNTIFAGSKITPNGTQTIAVESSVKQYHPYYDMAFDMKVDHSKSASSASSAAPKKKATHQEFSTAFQYWFDEDGVLAQDAFEADIAKFLANTEATHLE
ncbi:hypothetical protein BG006_001016 [Podila minutissima]|uniref:Signal peptidase complex subunit 2 n=1 Tax=Podila minutissima TaxID=64525 RepID=A0A9P5SPC5_9FUNG|nr:hypothetical protein BG006_001016 [Podila minutissima]